MTRRGFVQHMILASEPEKRLVSVVEHLIDSGPVVQYSAGIISDAAQLSSKGAGRRETVVSPEAAAQCFRE